MPNLDVTIVVCTFNRADLLRRAVESLTQLRTDDRFNYEILIVDNASTDPTSSVIDQLASAAAVPVRGVCEQRKGVSFARNCGIRAATGRWIAFFDDDQVADADWLLELYRAAQDRKVRCVSGRVRLLLSDRECDQLPAVCRSLLGESAPISEPQPFGRKRHFGAGSVLIERTVFDEVGLFDETLREGGEDTDLSRRMQAAGIGGWVIPTSVARHDVPSYRLTDEYFRWTSLRNGLHLAHRERAQFGAWCFPFVVAARVMRVAAQFVPTYVAGRLTRSRRRLLAARCQFWRIEAYVRHALARWLPRWFAQQDFLARLDFRGERQTFVERPMQETSNQGAAS